MSGVTGYQHRSETIYRTSIARSNIFIMQVDVLRHRRDSDRISFLLKSPEGRKKWPVTDEKIRRFSESFREKRS